MESHGLPLVAAREIYPADFALLDKLAKARLANPEVGGGIMRPEQRGSDLSPAHPRFSQSVGSISC